MRALYKSLKSSSALCTGYIKGTAFLSFAVCLLGIVPMTAAHAQEAAVAEAAPQTENIDDLVVDVVPPVETVHQPLVQPAPVNQTQIADVSPQLEVEQSLSEEDVFFQATGADDGATLYFDSEEVLPSTEYVRPVDPVDVNPVVEPGSRFIIVDKEHKASSNDALLVSAQRAMKLGRYKAARDMYATLYQKNSRDPRILMGRAIVMQHMGQFDAAMQAYDEFLEMEPDSVEARVNMLGLLGTKYPSVALQRLDALRDANPSHAGIVAQLAVNYGQLGNFTDALLYLEMASSIEPRNAGHVFNMAVMSDRLNEKKKAIEYYEQALEIDSIYGRSQSISRDAVYKRLSELR